MKINTKTMLTKTPGREIGFFQLTDPADFGEDSVGIDESILRILFPEIQPTIWRTFDLSNVFKRLRDLGIVEMLIEDYCADPGIRIRFTQFPG
jgi:hypothetical protein